jgi:hypothetical protein
MTRVEVAWLDGIADPDPALLGARATTISRLRAAG